MDSTPEMIRNPATKRMMMIGGSIWKKAVIAGELPLHPDYYIVNNTIRKRSGQLPNDETHVTNPITGNLIKVMGKDHKQLIRDGKLPLPEGYDIVDVKRKDGAQYRAIIKKQKGLKEIVGISDIQPTDDESTASPRISTDGEEPCEMDMSDRQI